MLRAAETSTNFFEYDAQRLLLAAAIFVPLTLAYLLLAYRDGRAFGTKSRKDLYTVPGVPLLGNLLTALSEGHRQMEWFYNIRAEQPLSEKSKAVSLTVPGQRIIDITRPSWIEHVQKTNFSNYVKGPVFYATMQDVLGDGIFNVDGDKWHAQRKATSHIFTASNFRGVISSSITEDIKTFKTIISRKADSGEAFDLGELFLRFTLSTFCRMAFSQDVGSLSLDTDAPVPFVKAFDFAQTQLNVRFRNPYWWYAELFSAGGKKMRKAVKTIDDFAYGIIRQREKQGLGNITASDKKDVEKVDLLSLYMALRDENGQPLSRKALRDATLNLIIAGRDTTAQALSWTMYHLMLNPHLIDPIRAEADEFGECTYDSYKTMTQTLAAFEEGLRLHPSVPKNGWRALADDHLPDGGPFVQKDDVVRWSDWEMGRDTNVWGPDASTFRPDRWIDEEGALRNENVWKYHAFNGGSRLCLGRNLALFEATTVMSTLFRDFDLTFAPGYLEKTEMCTFEKTPRYADSVTLPLHAPMMVVAKHRAR